MSTGEFVLFVEDQKIDVCGRAAFVLGNMRITKAGAGGGKRSIEHSWTMQI
jgi:hypothetical protein